MPIANFADELRDLREGLARASSLIDSTRRFGMPSSTISSLQSSLSCNIRAIDNAFTRCRSECGLEFERGDSNAAEAIEACNRELSRVAQNSHRLRPRDPIENDCGISEGKMLEGVYNGVEKDVIAAFDGLVRRIGGGSPGGGLGLGRGFLSQLSSFAGLGLGGTSERLHDGEVTVSRHDMAMMIQHLRDSWIQESVGGRTVYDNVYEPSMRRSERPRNGFIQEDRNRSMGVGLGAFRSRLDGLDGLGRGGLTLNLGKKSTGSVWDR